jgi:ribonucleoside-diphosphate reductase beta chain
MNFNDQEHNLLNAKPIYKPMKYTWAYDAWHIQQKIHWLPEEVPLSDDVKDWKIKLTDSERDLLTQIFRFFTQSDIEVNNCYMQHYSKVFKPTEICMMLAAFSNIETIHIDAYSKLLDTIGMPEVEYSAFLNYKEMCDKYEYMHSFNVDNKFNIALTLSGFGAFTEGLQLFASFAILLNFQRFSKMKGMCQIVAWSARDETLHANSIIRLFRTFLQENPEIDTPELKAKITQTCKDIVNLEDEFIRLAFTNHKIEGLTAEEVKRYIRYIGNRRLVQLGYDEVFEGVEENPFPWLDEMLNGVEFANFFENRVTEYSKSATHGSWDDAFIESEDEDDDENDSGIESDNESYIEDEDEIFLDSEDERIFIDVK